MPTKYYAASTIVPVTTDKVDPYTIAVLNSVKYELPLSPMLVEAASTDMRLILKKLYKYGDSGGYIFGLPNSSITIVPTIAEVILNEIALEHGVTVNDLVVPVDQGFEFQLVVDLDQIEFSRASFFGLEGEVSTLGAYLANPGAKLTTQPIASPYPDYYTLNNVNFPGDTYAFTRHYRKAHYTHHYLPNGDYSHTTVTYTWESENSNQTFIPNYTSVATNAYIVVKYSISTSTNVTRYKIYKEGSSPVLEPFTIPHGKYYPTIPIKIDFKYWNSPLHVLGYSKEIENIFKRYRLGELSQFSDVFEKITEDNGGTDEIDDVFLFHGVNVYSNNSEDNKYIYNYFLKLLLNEPLLILSDDTLTSNQVNIVQTQLNYSLLFRNITHTVVGTAPVNTKPITYSHEWLDGSDTPNLQWVNTGSADEGEYSQIQTFVSGENKYWSNNTYTITKTQNGVITDTLRVHGLQVVNQVLIAATEISKVIDSIPSGLEQAEYYTYLDLSKEELEDDSNEIVSPSITLVPLDKDVYTDTPLTNKLTFKETRGIGIRSTHFVIYGSLTVVVHWTKQLRIDLLRAISLAMTLYTVFTLGVDFTAAIKDQLLKKYLTSLVSQIAISKAVEFKLKQVFGKELGTTLNQVVGVASTVYGAVKNPNNTTLDLSLEFGFAIVKLALIKDAHDFSKEVKAVADRKLKDKIEEEETELVLASLLESPDEFLARTTNGDLGNMANDHLVSGDLIKEAKGLMLIYPNIDLNGVQ